LHSSDTVDLEKLVPQSSSVIRRTFRVETPLITISIKQIGGEGAVANPGHPQLEGADARLHLPLPVAISIAGSVFRAFIRLRLEVLGDLCLQHLVEHRLHKLGDAFVTAKKLMQQLGIYGNLIVGHPLRPPVGFV